MDDQTIEALASDLKFSYRTMCVAQKQRLLHGFVNFC